MLTPDVRARLRDAAVRGSVQDASRTIEEIRALDETLGAAERVAGLAHDGQMERRGLTVLDAVTHGAITRSRAFSTCCTPRLRG